MIQPRFNSRALNLIILSLCLLTAGNLVALDPAALYLTWQRSPDTTMSIQWLTPLNNKLENSQDVIQYSQDGSNTWNQATGTHSPLPEEAPYYFHTVELTNLQPATTYLIKVGTDGAGRTFKFKTLPATLQSNTTLSFVVGGDIYHDTIENFSRTNRLAAKTSPDFALLGGDIAYAAPKSASLIPSWIRSIFKSTSKQLFDRWLTWLIAWTNEMVTPDGCSIPLIPAIGNHDCNGSFNVTPAQAPFFYALFPMPGSQGYNVLDFGSYMSLFLLDTGHTHPIEGAQTEWLEKALKERNHVAIKFALYHVPAYPSARPYNYKHSVKIRANWTPLFDRYGLTAAFENHDHDFKRTYPLVDGKITAKGVLYFGDGAWGVGDPRKPSDSTSKGYIAKAVQATYFLHVAITDKEMKTTAINSKGQIIDSFNLNID